MGEQSAVTRLSLLPEGDRHLLDGRYQLIGEIASGGMASVFLARRAGFGGFQRLVAIKRLHPHLAGEQEFIDMFLDEARIAASIHHQNVVPILEIGASDTGYYLVMEYIEGVTLAKLMTHAAMAGNPLPPPVLLRCMVDALGGLHAAHELVDDKGAPLHVVHRDCSPQNLLIGLDGCTRITDFGIARARSRLHTTREGSMKGKLAYMAPEQTQGEDFDRRADVFSLGVVLWEMLAQRRLFKGKTEAETLKRLLEDVVPDIRRYAPTMPEALNRVCQRALARDPEQRYATAAAMADELEGAAAATLGLATHREVGALMGERYGADAHEQRDAVRSWLQATPTTLEPRGGQTDHGWAGPERSAVETRPPAPATRAAVPPVPLPATRREGSDAPPGSGPPGSPSRFPALSSSLPSTKSEPRPVTTTREGSMPNTVPVDTVPIPEEGEAASSSSSPSTAKVWPPEKPVAAAGATTPGGGTPPAPPAPRKRPPPAATLVSATSEAPTTASSAAAATGADAVENTNIYQASDPGLAGPLGTGPGSERAAGPGAGPIPESAASPWRSDVDEIAGLSRRRRAGGMLLAAAAFALLVAGVVTWLVFSRGGATTADGDPGPGPATEAFRPTATPEDGTTTVDAPGTTRPSPGDGEVAPAGSARAEEALDDDDLRPRSPAPSSPAAPSPRAAAAPRTHPTPAAPREARPDRGRPAPPPSADGAPKTPAPTAGEEEDLSNPYR
ncbi:MAG: protein kinase [Myxococcota bacterium]